jgi:pimeloyl-ACP methyl ester carboxylesterase
MTPIPIPAQAPATEGRADLPDTRLWHWDTGGEGPPIVLLHPMTGSGLIWVYQQPAFVRAGHRVIGYSRRGYIHSAPYSSDNAGIGSVDLDRLLTACAVDEVHLVASAAGGSIAADYALSHPDKVRTLTVSSNAFGLREGAIFDAAKRIKPAGWDDMPSDFRELGPSYRAANPEGTKAWLDLEHRSLIGSGYQQRLANKMTQARLAELRMPVLLIAGAADLLTPPSISRMLAAAIPNSRVVIAPESGHSAYWEEPDLFNRAVLDFIAQHR